MAGRAVDKVPGYVQGFPVYRRSRAGKFLLEVMFIVPIREMSLAMKPPK